MYSPNLTSPCSVNKIFPPLISLWTLKIECRYARPYWTKNDTSLKHIRYETDSLKEKKTEAKDTKLNEKWTVRWHHCWKTESAQSQRQRKALMGKLQWVLNPTEKSRNPSPCITWESGIISLYYNFSWRIAAHRFCKHNICIASPLW